MISLWYTRDNGKKIIAFIFSTLLMTSKIGGYLIITNNIFNTRSHTTADITSHISTISIKLSLDVTQDGIVFEEFSNAARASCGSATLGSTSLICPAVLRQQFMRHLAMYRRPT
jgi:hypothetical protein